jgi:hypothetical protein
MRRQFALPMRLIETTAELGRSSGRTAIVGEAAGFLYHARGGLRHYGQTVGAFSQDALWVERNLAKLTSFAKDALWM